MDEYRWVTVPPAVEWLAKYSGDYNRIFNYYMQLLNKDYEVVQ